VWELKKTDATLDLENLLSQYQKTMQYAAIVAGLPIDNALKYESGLSLFKHKIPVDFPCALVGLTFWSFSENLSLIPLLGL
jgi:hypothetical protein